jgi:hypothetical protein
MNYRKPYPVDGVAAPDPGNVVIFARHTETLVGHGADLELLQEKQLRLSILKARLLL